MTSSRKRSRSKMEKEDQPASQHQQPVQTLPQQDIQQSTDVTANLSTSTSTSTSTEETKNEQEATDKDVCCICLDEVSLPIRTACRHVFCFLCLKSVCATSMTSQSHCPLCRAVIPPALINHARVTIAHLESKLRQRADNNKHTNAKTNSNTPSGSSRESVEGEQANDDPFVWQYAGRSGGFWLYDDKSSDIIEQQYQQAMQWQQQQKHKPATASEAEKADITDTTETTSSSSSTASSMTHSHCHSDSHSGQTSSQSDSSSDDDSDLSDDESASDDSSDDDDRASYNIPVVPTDSLSLSRAISGTLFSADNPHRFLLLSIGAVQYRVDLLTFEQKAVNNTQASRRINRSTAQQVKAVLELQKQRSTNASTILTTPTSNPTANNNSRRAHRTPSAIRRAMPAIKGQAGLHLVRTLSQT